MRKIIITIWLLLIASCATGQTILNPKQLMQGSAGNYNFAAWLSGQTYLQSLKLAAGSNVLFTVTGSAPNQTLTISASGGGTYTFPSSVLSSLDLSSTSSGYGTSWYTRSSGAGELTWSVFGSDDAQDFWVTKVSSFNRGTNTTQKAVDGLMDQVYQDFDGNTSTAHSNFTIVSDAINDGGSYTQSITKGQTATSDWNFSNFSGSTQTAVGNLAQIPFYYSAYSSTTGQPATEIGTFELNTSGQLMFTVVPEPATWATVLIGAATLIGIGRLRRA